MRTLWSGGDKAKTFEPLASVLEWLIANPNPDWTLQLKEASQFKTEQMEVLSIRKIKRVEPKLASL